MRNIIEQKLNTLLDDAYDSENQVFRLDAQHIYLFIHLLRQNNHATDSLTLHDIRKLLLLEIGENKEYSAFNLMQSDLPENTNNFLPKIIIKEDKFLSFSERKTVTDFINDYDKSHQLNIAQIKEDIGIVLVNLAVEITNKSTKVNTLDRVLKIIEQVERALILKSNQAGKKASYGMEDISKFLADVIKDISIEQNCILNLATLLLDKTSLTNQHIYNGSFLQGVLIEKYRHNNKDKLREKIINSLGILTKTITNSSDSEGEKEAEQIVVILKNETEILFQNANFNKGENVRNFYTNCSSTIQNFAVKHNRNPNLSNFIQKAQEMIHPIAITPKQIASATLFSIHHDLCVTVGLDYQPKIDTLQKELFDPQKTPEERMIVAKYILNNVDRKKYSDLKENCIKIQKNLESAENALKNYLKSIENRHNNHKNPLIKLKNYFSKNQKNDDIISKDIEYLESKINGHKTELANKTVELEKYNSTFSFCRSVINQKNDSKCSENNNPTFIQEKNGFFYHRLDQIPQNPASNQNIVMNEYSVGSAHR